MRAAILLELQRHQQQDEQQGVGPEDVQRPSARVSPLGTCGSAKCTVS